MNRRTRVGSSTTEASVIEQGRESFRRQAWASAFSQLSAGDTESPLEPEDLVLVAQAARLIGRDAEGTDFLARAHQGFLGRGESQWAARCAFWLGFTSMLSGESAKAGGWFSRASRLLEGLPGCVEKGYLRLPEGYRSFHAGDAANAQAMFEEAAAVGKLFGDKDLIALATQGHGRALIRQGEIVQGVALLDEAMVAVTAGEVSPLNAGGVYCSVLDACGEIFDMQRAQEWTSALERWCESQPDIVPFRGHCQIRRAELLQLHGDWQEALEQAQQAGQWFSRSGPRTAAGAAHYQMGEIHRLRGRFAEAEEAYQQASQWQSGNGPGLARLLLAQGKVDAAHAAVRRMAEQVCEFAPRTRVLDAYVEIALAANDHQAARAARDELTGLATRYAIPFVNALALRASGAVFFAEDEEQPAMMELTESWRLWCELQAPYEASRDQLLLGQACRKLGDEDHALLEFSAARQTFARLGAAHDLSRVDALLPGDVHKTTALLTEREVQVLRLVASGLTNRRVASKLNISEKTVARHLSNIFVKLDLRSRTAAAAYAYEHELV
jgi:DNA-binding CsgD family transcriptional regulator